MTSDKDKDEQSKVEEGKVTKVAGKYRLTPNLDLSRKRKKEEPVTNEEIIDAQALGLDLKDQVEALADSSLIDLLIAEDEPEAGSEVRRGPNPDTLAEISNNQGEDSEDEFRLDFDLSQVSSEGKKSSLADSFEVRDEYIEPHEAVATVDEFEVQVGEESGIDEIGREFLEAKDYKEFIRRAKQKYVYQKDQRSQYQVTEPGFRNIGTPEELIMKLGDVGYHCAPYLAAQMCLSLTTEPSMVRAILLEGPPGCGKSFMAKCLAKVTGAKFQTLSCYPGMSMQNLIEVPSSLGMAKAMAGNVDDPENLMQLGVMSRVFLESQKGPIIFLVDELDKCEKGLDTFFLGPIQDGKLWLESRAPIEANLDNLLIVFTKNFERSINDALLRRVQPITMSFIDSSLEKKILSEECLPQLIKNLTNIADTMRYSDASYRFERAPAPEELLRIGRYVMQLLEWDIVDFSFVGRNIWNMMSKSENDRFVLELMLRYHPDFFDSLKPNGRKLTKDEVYAKLGRLVLRGVVKDPDEQRRKEAYAAAQVGLTNVGTPEMLIKKLEEVGYECLPYLAMQIALLLNTPSERVRALLLEGPSGCGKSFMAKSLAKITGAEFMCLSCYSGMNTQHLIESPSASAIANVMAGTGESSKDDLMNLGIVSRAFLKSQNQPVILLVDEIDKVEVAIDTFFLGPIQDATIYPESRPPIDANLDNLLIVFTKNFERPLNDALLRRIHPIPMTYLDSKLEKKILSNHCTPKLIENLVAIVDRMRNNNGTYGFDRPPAPEELLGIGHYVNQMLDWGIKEFSDVGRNIWTVFAKSEHDREVLDYMMRFHPDYLDPLVPDGRNMTKEQVWAKLGRIVLEGIVHDPDAKRREKAWDAFEYN